MSKPKEHEYVSQVAYTRALEQYCTELESLHNKVAEQAEEIRLLKQAVRHGSDCVDAAAERIAEQAAVLRSIETQRHQHDHEERKTYRGLSGAGGSNAVLPPLQLGVPAIYKPSSLQEADAASRNTHAKGF